MKADGGGQYLLVVAECGFRGRGRYQGETVVAKKRMEISQLRLGEMDKKQAGAYAVELPVPVQHFPKK